MRKKLVALAAALTMGLSGLGVAPAFAQTGPAVKMSKTGICHPRGGTYYSKTQNYTPYPSMDACIKAGGKPPKR